MIAEPPLSVGAVQVRVTWVSPAVPATDVAAVGVVTGVADAVAEAVPVPTAFTALTRKV